MSVVLKEVSKSFGSQKAVDSISFEVNKGEILGFLGPNGAGKSTTMKMITGFLEIDSGSIEVAGMPVEKGSVETKKHIGYLSEANPLYYDMYVREYLGFIAEIHQIKKPRQRIESLLEQTGLDKEANKLIGNLSKGYKQRVGLVQALIHDPEILILDEPTSGLDMNQLVDIRSLIRSYKDEKTIIFSTHIMQEVQALCTRVLIINDGKMVADRAIGDLNALAMGTKRLRLELSKPCSDKTVFDKINHLRLIAFAANVLEFEYPDNVDPREEIFKLCVDNQFVIIGMSLVQKDVEQVFRQLTKGENHA